MDASYGKLAWDASGTPIPFEQSLAILSSVVSRPVKERAVLDVGWKSASSDSGPPAVRGLAGASFEFAGDEHGTLRGIEAMSLRPGDRIELVPSHCDTTVNLYDRIVACRGEEIVDLWPIAARGHSQ
jgi:D-serine deaminase-like pyridoxal phosphate-dependent protein